MKKITLLLLLLMCLVSNQIMAQILSETNLAKNCSVKASSTETNQSASNAVDGDAGTKWGCNYNDPNEKQSSWFAVDLGETKDFTTIRIQFNNQAPVSAYIVTGTGQSLDEVAWNTEKLVTLGTASGNAENNRTYTYKLSNQNARFIKIQCEQSGDYGMGFLEFEVYNATYKLTSVTATPANVRVNIATEMTLKGFDQFGEELSGVTFEVVDEGAATAANYSSENGTLTATKTGTVHFNGTYNEVIVSSNNVAIYEQTLDHITVSPQILRAGQSTKLTLTAYDQQNEVITDGVTYITDKGTINPDNTLVPTGNGTVTVTGKIGEAEGKTFEIYALGDAEAPRIPTDVYLSLYTTIESNEKTVWGWGTDPVGEIKLMNRPSMLFRDFEITAVNNQVAPFGTGDFGVRFDPKANTCKEIKMDVFSPVGDVKVRIVLEGVTGDGDWVPLTKGWNEIKRSVEDVENLVSVKLQAEDNAKPELLISNVYFTKVHNSSNGPTWESAPVVSKTEKTMATITMTATDDLSTSIMYILTDTENKDDATYFTYVRGKKGEPAKFELGGLTPGKEYTFYVTAFDEGGLASGVTAENSTPDVKTVTFTTDNINITSVKVTPKLQYVHGGELTSALEVIAVDDNKVEYKEGFKVSYTVKSEDETGLLTDVNEYGQFKAKEVSDLKKAIVTVTVSSGEGEGKKEAVTDITIMVYKDKQFNLTYKIGSTEYPNVNVNTGELSKLTDYLNITELTVNSGFLNNDDIRALRQMAGAESCLVNAAVDDLEADGKTPTESDHDELPAETKTGTTGVLSKIDLSSAILVADGEPYASYNGVVRVEGVGTDTGERTLVECKITDASTLPNHIFANCVNLTEVKLPSGVDAAITAAEGSAHFAGCTNLTSVEGLKGIEGATPQYLFYKSGLTSIDLTDYKFDEIGASSFRSCESLKAITFKNDLKRINFNAFQNCKVLDFADGYKFPETLTHIDNLSFKDCPALTGGLEFPKSLEYIGQSAFENDIKLAYITLPVDGSLEVIENSAFLNCYALTLTNSVMPDALKRINNGAFKNCISLGLAKGTSSTYELKDGEIDKESVSIAETRVAVTLPKAVEYIGYEAFGNCRNLDLAETEDYRLPASCSEIDNLAFSDCVSLTGTITFPTQTPREKIFEDGTVQSRSRINNGVFMNCVKLEKVILPEGMQEIDANAFASSGVKGDNGVVSMPSTIVEIGNHAFGDTPNLDKLIIPGHEEEFLVTVQNVAFQNSAISDIEFGENVVIKMESHVFFECKNLKDAEAKKIMEHEKDGIIRNAVFWGCTGLQDIVIPENIGKIDEAAFAQFTSGNTVEEQSVTSNIKTITVTSASAPVCITHTDKIDNNPFFGCDPNHVEIVFDATAEAGYTTYRNTGDQSEWMRLLTKTASEGLTTEWNAPKAYDVVKQKHGDFILTRTFDANSWNTLVLPFMISQTQKNTTLGLGTEIPSAYFTRYQPRLESFRFDVNHDKLSAFKPFIVKIGSTNTDNEYHFVDVNVNFNDEGSTGYAPENAPVAAYDGDDNGYTFTGTYVLTTNIPVNSYVLKGNQGIYTSATLKAASQGFRAWIQKKGESTGDAKKQIALQIMGLEGGSTAVDQTVITAGGEPFDVYGMNGQLVRSRVSSLYGLPKGVYVVNGRKVIVK